MPLSPVAWPSTLLCASNQKLADQIEELTTKLSQQQQSCEEAREVVTIMKENETQARSMIALAEKELARKRQEAEATESGVKRTRLENEKTAREVAAYETEVARLRVLSAQMQETVAATHQGLSTEIQRAASYEDAAKEALWERLAREKQGEALEREMTRLSSQVWTRLSRLNEEVAQRQLTLQAAREEHAHVLTELEHARHSLRAALQDQQGTVEELAHVQAESAATDQLILVNSNAMQALKERAASKANVKTRLAKTLLTLTTDNKVAHKQAEAKRSAHDSALQRMRNHLQGLREHAVATISLNRQHTAERQHRQHLASSLANVSTLAEERQAGVRQHQEYRQQLEQLVRAVEREARENPLPSPAAMLAMHTTLQQQLARCEDRLERVQGRVTGAIADMVTEGRRGEERQEQLAHLQKRARALQKEHHEKNETLRSVMDRLRAIDEEAERKREMLPELKAVSLLQYEHRRRQCEARIAEMRERLSDTTALYQRLLRGNTALRLGVRRAKDTLREQQTGFAEEAERGVLLASEVPTLEKELAALESRSQQLLSDYGRAQLTFASLTAAADGQVHALQQSAGMEDLLRAEMAAQEASLEADMQSALVELHLQQAALREQREELRRQARRRDLLRSRHEELMQAITRTVAAAPLLGAVDASANAPSGHNTPPVPVPSLGAVTEDATPEALHARLLLQRSYAREQLMQKGNYLDLRLVSLDRETATLRGMLEALKAEQSKQPPPSACARGQSAATPLTSRTDPNKRVVSAQHRTPSAIKGPTGATDASVAWDEREELMQAELRLQEAALAAMHEQSELSRGQLKTLRKALQELRALGKQKQLQLQRLQDQVQRQRHQAVQQESKRLAGVVRGRK